MIGISTDPVDDIYEALAATGDVPPDIAGRLAMSGAVRRSAPAVGDAPTDQLDRHRDDRARKRFR